MKQSLSILAAGLIAVRAQAPNSLPQCGQTCVNNMLQIAVSEFGCNANDLASCACCNADFGYGIRDCSRQACGEGSNDYSSVVSYGSSYCASAVSTCPSGTQATNVIASATGGGQGSGTGASGSAATPAMTSGPMSGGAGGAGGAVSMVSGQSNAYVVNGQTITAGGDSVDENDTAYSALPSGAGVLISNGNMQTTYVPGSGAGGSGMSSGMMTMSSSGGGNAGGAGGALGAAASQVSTGSGQNNYVVAGDNTISAGGNNYANDGTTYSALPSGGGVLVVANGSSSTVNPASNSAGSTGGSGGGAGGASGSSSGSGGSGGSGGTGGGAGGASATSGGSGGNGGNGGGSSGQSGNFAPVQTAAPALIGAAAMAILAF